MDNDYEISGQELRNNSALEIMIVNIFVLIISIFGLLLYLIFKVSSYTLIPYVSLLFTMQMTWIIYSNYKYYKSLLNPFTLFVIALILFNGGQIIIQGFSFSHINIYGGYRYDEILNSIYFISISIQMFNLGGGLTTKYNKIKRSSKIDFKDIRVVGWFFIIIAFVPYMITAKEAITIVFKGGYISLFEQDLRIGVSSTIDIIATFMIPGFLFLLAGSKNHRFGRYTSLFFLISNTLIQFFLGSRSSAIMPFIAYVWLWDSCVRRISRKHLILGTLVVFIAIFPLISVTRGYSGADKMSILSIFNVLASLDNPILLILSEMGNTFRPVFYSMILVPTSRPFDLGLSYIYSLIAIFPNLFWDLHPTVSRGLLGSWVTRAAYGSSYKSGFGFSAIAEAYVNFGWFLGALFMGVLGYLLKKLIDWSNNGDVYSRKALIASFMSFGLFFARGESAGLTRYLFWYSVIPYISIYFFKDFKGGIK